MLPQKFSAATTRITPEPLSGAVAELPQPATRSPSTATRGRQRGNRTAPTYHKAGNESHSRSSRPGARLVGQWQLTTGASTSILFSLARDSTEGEHESG